MRFFALSIIRRALALYEIPSDIMGASAQGRNGVASSTLGCTQDVVPVGLPSAAICLRRKNSAEWQNALNPPGSDELALLEGHSRLYSGSETSPAPPWRGTVDARVSFVADQLVCCIQRSPRTIEKRRLCVINLSTRALHFASAAWF
jgi:hypothetical protein